jgi:hypothetical protein
VHRLELETPEAPEVHCTYADKQIYIHFDVSGQWPADTLLVQPLPANMSDPSHLHEWLNGWEYDYVHDPCYMLEKFDNGHVYPAMHPVPPMPELKAAALRYFAMSLPESFDKKRKFFTDPPVSAV